MGGKAGKQEFPSLPAFQLANSGLMGTLEIAFDHGLLRHARFLLMVANLSFHMGWRTITISQQRWEVSKWMANICAGIGIHAVNDFLNGIDLTKIISNGTWWIANDCVLLHIKDQGSWVRDLFIGLSDEEKPQVLQEIGKFAVSIVAEGSQVQAERDGNNNASELEAPPVMPIGSATRDAS